MMAFRGIAALVLGSGLVGCAARTGVAAGHEVQITGAEYTFIHPDSVAAGLTESSESSQSPAFVTYPAGSEQAVLATPGSP